MIHLTGHNFSPREIIQNVFSPLIGVITSPLADEMCYKNNLSFVELLQPFSKLTSEAHFRDTNGTSVSVKGLRLNVCDIGWRPPQTVLARKMLNESVANGNCDKVKIIDIGSTALEIPALEPWFESWRETFLTVQFPADHEFTRHFLSCLVILASSDPNILDSAHQLTKRVQMMQNITPQKLPKWFSSDVLNSYVLLHDGSQGDITKAQQSFDLLKSTFGENKCFLIQINSVTENPTECPDPWIHYIKRQPKVENNAEQGSTPKTPQDTSMVTSMPASVQSSSLESPEEGFLHPLSPVQEQATEAIHSRYSASTESINSQTINPNVWASEIDADAPHGMWLTASDVDNLKHFVQDYTVRALIPYIERLVAILNEAITNKKGVSKSLLSATKRWFVTNKPGAGASSQNAVIYTAESVELQTRKLGDLYFMFGNYNMAFQAYHQAKRDFNADSAWQYYAGALEMAALSAFMLGTANRKTYDYMEDAIVCYLTVCKLPQFATRATLLSMECLKSARLYGEAAKQLIRMTSEDSDLRSALLLEQASYCFISTQPPMYRKYAFHVVLSGNRYSRAGQRKHAFRCYKQASQVFQDRGWYLAEDHIQYTIGKQAVTLKKLTVAIESLAHLLRPTSLQDVTQQAAFLREYIATQKELISRSPNIGLLEISLPKVVQSSIKILVTSYPPVANPMFTPATNINIESDLKDEFRWQKLEEMLVQTASSKPIVFKPSKSLFTSENPTTDNPLSVHGEPIDISVSIMNAIKTSITFSDIHLLWEFVEGCELTITNKILFEGKCSQEEKNIVHSTAVSTTISQIVLNEREEKDLHFKITPKLIGELRIKGIVGNMSATNEPSSLMGCIYFEAQQIKSVERSQPAIQFDNKLNIKILPLAPSLHVSFSHTPKEVLVGEIIPVTVCLRNSGIAPIDNIYIGCETPRWITIFDNETGLPLAILRDYRDLSQETLSKDKETRQQHVFRVLKKDSQETSLNSQETKTIQMWIQAPYQKGSFKLRLLVYYSMPENYPKIKYRLVRHEWIFIVHESLQSKINCVISNQVTHELALDFDLKNLNQVHHPLTAELYINSIDVFSGMYKLKSDRIIYINQMEVTEGQLNEKCLKSAKSSSFRCCLEEIQNQNSTDNTDGILSSKVSNLGTLQGNYNDDNTFKEYVRNRLSSISLISNNTKANNIPEISELYSFLMKNETKFLNVFNNNTNTEEFNNIVSTKDPHMTVILTWCAIVTDTNSVKRTAHGQHFIQLRNLYEQVSCPETPDYRVKTYLRDHQTYHKICEFKETVKSRLTEDDEGQWETNNHFVGKRCLLEDESYTSGNAGKHAVDASIKVS